ncbi:helix-turn-helix transcriptional regulator [Desulfitobacterium sp.]|uniref:helix-turn-helix domain-containing protein n=1 Tax=Desulfitobacterium sp. TaxID=49981 RepID=UPI002BA8918D|nr:helix-turn-helix transcriptional regulator [Desulfitobacterium sp.]HVJ47972.1 helix-turn-helix transcriptional regulator [Desulfitobacterium sp.]
MVYKHLGQRIREERTKYRLTQEQLAEAAQVNESYVGQVERGEKNPSLETVVNIASSLGVTVDYLLQEEVNVEPNSLINELVSIAKNKEPEELRLMLNIWRMISEYSSKLKKK